MTASDNAPGLDLDAAREDYIREWQQGVAAVLIKLLAHGGAARLPAISWKISGAAPQLNGACEQHPESRRLTDFIAWKTALAALAGPPDEQRDDTHPSQGMTAAFAVWHRYDRVCIVLSAEWWDDHVAVEATAEGPAL